MVLPGRVMILQVIVPQKSCWGAHNGAQTYELLFLCVFNYCVSCVSSLVSANVCESMFGIRCREKVDSWAMGVILLSIMTRRYPFFTSGDKVSDSEALQQIATIFGYTAVTELGLLLSTCSKVP